MESHLSVLYEARKKRPRKWKLKFSFDTYQTIQDLELEGDQKELITQALKTIEKDPYEKGTSRIKKSKKNARRIRAGNYRIVYRVKDYKGVISIVLIRHRQDINYELVESF